MNSVYLYMYLRFMNQSVLLEYQFIFNIFYNLYRTSDIWSTIINIPIIYLMYRHIIMLLFTSTLSHKLISMVHKFEVKTYARHAKYEASRIRRVLQVWAK